MNQPTSSIPAAENQGNSRTPWNSLEVTKLLISIITPLTLLGVGAWFNARLNDIEKLQWANQRVVEQRIRFFNDYSDPLNDLFSYMTFVGNWKDVSPESAVNLKRKLDKMAYVNAPLFPDGFLDRHNEFMKLCFETHQGWGVDAKLRTKFQRRKDAIGEHWNQDWERYFSTSPVPELKEIRSAYAEYQAYIASNLGVGLRNPPNIPTEVPIGVK